MTTFHSNNPESQNSPHWVGNEVISDQEKSSASEHIMQILDYVEDRGEPIWSPEEYDEDKDIDKVHFSAAALARHIYNNAGDEKDKKRRAWYKGLKVAKADKQRLLEGATTDYDVIESIINKPDPLTSLRNEFKTGGNVTDVLADFIASAAWLKETNTTSGSSNVIEPKLRVVAVEDAVNDLGTAVYGMSADTDRALIRLLQTAQNNARRRQRLFDSHLKTLESMTQPPKSTPSYRGTLKDQYVQDKRFLEDL